MNSASDSARSLDRIVVVGTSGSGKTSLARRLSRHLNATHIELDALHWGPDWMPAEPDAFRAAAAAAVSADRWVCEGNYKVVRDIIWPHATAFIWLDYSFGLVLWRAVKRTFVRTVTRERLYAGNREPLLGFFDRDWIPWWVIRTHGRRRREFSALLLHGEYAERRVLVMRTPKDTELFLSGLHGPNLPALG